MATRSPREETRTARADPNAPGADQAQASERAAVIREERKKRVPLGVPRTKLTAPTRPGYQRRWINDDAKGRLQHAKEGGYTHVEDPNLLVGEDGGGDKTDSRVSRIVGKRDDGKPLRAFLMEIPSELYKEDQASKQAELDEVDRSIRKGRLVSQGEEHRYVPDDGRGIRVDSEVKRSDAGRQDAE
jgi:hypothetical protein